MSLRMRTSQLVTPAMRFWWRRTRAMTLGVRVLATDAEGAVVMVRHTYVAGWHLPGGGVERGERAEISARRELVEETGAEPSGPLALMGVFANFRSFRGDHVLLFRANVTARVERPADREIAEVGWFSPLAPPEGTTPATRRRLAEAFTGAEPALDW